MANTVVVYPGDGVTRKFTVPFDYLNRTFVRIYVNGTEEAQGTTWSFISPTVIERVAAPLAGETLTIRRVTSTNRIVDFKDASVLRSFDLNTSQLQVLHIAEEAKDMTVDTISTDIYGNLDARWRRIAHVANPVEDGDALNYGTYKADLNGAAVSRDRAEAAAQRSADQAVLSQSWADAASSHKVAAEGSATTASTAATTATNAKAAAATSASKASAAALTAQAWTDAAKSHADNAKVSEDAAQNVVDNAVESVRGEFTDLAADAKASEVAAKGWADAASDSAVTASNEALKATNAATTAASDTTVALRGEVSDLVTQATTQADKSKTEADRAKAEADRAQSVVDDAGVQLPDGVTIYTNNGKLTVGNVAIGGDLGDLVSARGLFNAKSTGAVDCNTLTNQGVYAIPQSYTTNGPGFPIKMLLLCSANSLLTTQLGISSGGSTDMAQRLALRNRNKDGEWSKWAEFFNSLRTGDGLKSINGIISVPEYEGATTSTSGTSGLVPPAAAGQQESFLTGGGEYKPALTTNEAGEATKDLGVREAVLRNSFNNLNFNTSTLKTGLNFEWSEGTGKTWTTANNAIMVYHEFSKTATEWLAGMCAGWKVNGRVTTHSLHLAGSGKLLLDKQEVRHVKQSYLAGDLTKWYRLWSDGWIEQGGTYVANGDSTITYPTPFANNLGEIRTLMVTPASGNYGNFDFVAFEASNTSFNLVGSGWGGNVRFNWFACGF